MKGRDNSKIQSDLCSRYDTPLFKTRISSPLIIAGLIWLITVVSLLVLGMSVGGMILYGALGAVAVIAVAYNECILVVCEDHFKLKWIFRGGETVYHYHDIRDIEFRRGEFWHPLTIERRSDYLHLLFKKGDPAETELIVSSNRADMRAGVDMIREKLGLMAL